MRFPALFPVRPLKGQRGFVLAEVMVASGLLAFVSAGFLAFMRHAGRAQSNLAKTGEVATIDMTVRTLLQNNSACTATANQLNFALQKVPQPAKIVDGMGGTVLDGTTAKPTRNNGLELTSLTATVSAPDGGVYLVRLDVSLTKVGDALARWNYTNTYYINAVKPNPALPVASCLITNGQGSEILVGYQRQDFPATASSDLIHLIYNPLGVPLPWGPNTPTNPDVVIAPVVNCNMEPYPPTCAKFVYPGLTVKAQGNRMQFSFSGYLSLASLGTQPSYNFDAATNQVVPNPAQTEAWGAELRLRVTDSSGNPLLWERITRSSRGTETGGFNGSEGATGIVEISVTQGQVYNVTPVCLLSDGTNLATGYAVRCRMVKGTILHYIKS